MMNKTFTFNGFVDNVAGHGITSSLIYVPQHILNLMQYKSRTRVQGKINDAVEFNLAIQPLKTGEKYLSISTDLRRKAKIKVGDNISVSFQIADPNHLEIPEELIVAMEQDEIAAKIFKSFTVGYQRSLVHYVNTAKSIDVRIERALKLLEKAKSGEFEIQKKKKGKLLLSHRSTTCPCYIPVLGNFSRSWS